MGRKRGRKRPGAKPRALGRPVPSAVSGPPALPGPGPGESHRASPRSRSSSVPGTSGAAGPACPAPPAQPGAGPAAAAPFPARELPRETQSSPQRIDAPLGLRLPLGRLAARGIVLVSPGSRAPSPPSVSPCVPPPPSQLRQLFRGGRWAGPFAWGPGDPDSPANNQFFPSGPQAGRAPVRWPRSLGAGEGRARSPSSLPGPVRRPRRPGWGAPPAARG